MSSENKNSIAMGRIYAENQSGHSPSSHIIEVENAAPTSNSVQEDSRGSQSNLVLSNSAKALDWTVKTSIQDSDTELQPGLVLSNSGKTLDQTGKQYVNDTELHLAAKKGDLEAVKLLLGGVNVKYGSQNGHADCGEIDIEMEKIQSSLVNEVNELAETPLHIAAEQGHLEVLRELLKFAHPETIMKQNHTGFNVLHIAAKQGHIGIVKELLSHQPSLSKTFDRSNATPLISAATKSHIEAVDELLAIDCQLIGIARSNGKNALHFAARSGYTEIVTALLERKPNMARRTDKKGQTALHMAAKGANCLEVVKVLLKVDPAIVKIPDKNGNTPLHVATRKERDEIVKEFLKMMPDIDVNALNGSYKTAMDLSEELSDSEAANEIKDCLAASGALKATNTMNLTIYNLENTVSEINRNIIVISKELTKLHREGINNSTNSLKDVAVLFATVAFAAIFTVPGGNINSGEATAAKRPSFQIFFIFNALALFTSLAIVVVHVTLVRWETEYQRKVVEVINKLMWVASVCTSVSFIASAYIVAGRHCQWSAITVTIIGGIIMVGVLGSITYFGRHVKQDYVKQDYVKQD